MLCFLPALYAFAVFGYVTAALATYFVGRDAESSETELAGAEDVSALHEELRGLRAELQSMSQQRSERQCDMHSCPILPVASFSQT